MTVVAVGVGLWLMVLIGAVAVVRASRGGQDPSRQVPVDVSADGGSNVPNDEPYFRAVASAEADLRTFERSQRPEDRDHFLSTMAVLVRLGDSWMTRRLPSQGIPEDVRATLLRCVTARDELLRPVVASNHAWAKVAVAASEAQAMPDLRSVDRAELARLERHAWSRVIDLATITRMPHDHGTDVRATD